MQVQKNTLQMMKVCVCVCALVLDPEHAWDGHGYGNNHIIPLKIPTNIEVQASAMYMYVTEDNHEQMSVPEGSADFPSNHHCS